MKPLYLLTYLFIATGALAKTYTTNFPLAENPISENGAWINGGVQGIDWTNVRKTQGMAIGTMPGNATGNARYADSTAVLAGRWGPNQTAQATIVMPNPTGTSSIFEEVELRLRTTISAHSITGYEINASVNTDPDFFYVQIVRWNGPLGSWTQIAGITYHVKDGDVFKATVVGNLITAYVNGVQLCQATDDNYTNGSPGIGLYLDSQTGLNANYGLTNFRATDGQESSSTTAVSTATPRSTNTPSPTASPSARPSRSGPPRIVQHASNAISGSIGAITGVYSSSEIAGDLNIIQVIHPSAQRVVSVADTQGNSYRLARSIPVSHYQLEVWYATSVAPGLDVVTVKFNSSTSNPGICFAEASGVSTLEATAAKASNLGAAMNSGAVTISDTPELLWGSFLTGNFFQSAGSGWTHLDTDDFGDGSEYRVISVGGSHSATATQSASSFSASILAAFR
jgi:hypothetical protein